MSARSFALELVALAAALGACAKTAKRPEADPAKVEALATAMINNTPMPAAVPACTPASFAAAVPMTQRTVLQLAKMPISAEPERADWINPTEIDAPSARLLVDSADTIVRRQAAAELLAAKSYMVYRVDMVNAPIALMVKELKRGGVGMRAIGYDKRGEPTCVTVFIVQQDKQKSEWAMDQSNKAFIDPKVAQVLRDDLKEQLLERVAEMTTPPAPPAPPAPR
jgi:hypothetical protein